MNTATDTQNNGHEAGSQYAGPQSGPTADYRGQTLQRPCHDRMLGGVASGIARYFGIDETVVRIVFAVLTVVGGAGIPLYLAGWLLIPEEGQDQSLASQFLQSLQNRPR